ncbi:hypothetical protein [Frigidibacter sp. SD6-1]|uniref:DUF7946 domain-containing protein n=1 Tax=Frigidibacter sp. SD6-1 TaxID=3032581 RepID=UPI0024DFF622|nr:hypothetical protein [Frigidibacter sp. SD6-1]
MDQQLVFKLDGGMASDGEVPAFASLESVHGFSQAIMMILHFSETGEIRRRGFKELDTDLRLVATKDGSFDFLFEFKDVVPVFVEAYGKGLANASWELIRTVFSRAIGAAGSPEIEAVEEEGALNTGDLGALVQAAEPAIRKAHSVINNGSSNINIFINGDGNRIILDSRSKEYMHENIFNDETRSQRFLVTSFDGRNRTGRLFDLEAEQAFTFDLTQEADRASLTVIVDAARAYALREKGKFDELMEVVCAFTSIDAADGRTKRLKVYAAARDFDTLEAGEFIPVVKAAPRAIGGDDDLIERDDS